MRTFRGCVTCLILLTTTTFCEAGGLIQKIPADGAWVKYFMMANLFGPGAFDSKYTGRWTIRSVGHPTLKGRKYRWIEFHRHFDRSATVPAGDNWIKYLVPEQALVSEKDASAHVVRIWGKSDTEMPGKTEPSADSDVSRYYGLFLQGLPRKKIVRSRHPRVIAYQHGELKCPMQTVEVFEYKSVDDTHRRHRFEVQCTLWKHKDVPFGVAAARIVWKRWIDGKLIWTWKHDFLVNDFGSGAKSALPNSW